MNKEEIDQMIFGNKEVSPVNAVIQFDKTVLKMKANKVKRLVLQNEYQLVEIERE